MNKHLLKHQGVFLYLFTTIVLFFPYPYYFFTSHKNAIQYVTDSILLPLFSFLFHGRPKITQVISDSKIVTLGVVVSALIGIVLYVLVTHFQTSQEKTKEILRDFLRYFLVLIFIQYGWVKILGIQFYSPEPNILYSEFGHLEKDILFWSTLGLSKLYNIVTGSIECVIALLLCFRKTLFLGLLLALIACFQIVLINFSFDISVKTFSLLLSLITLTLLSPYFKNIKHFIQQEYDKVEPPKSEGLILSQSFQKGFKAIFIIFLVLEMGALTRYSSATKASENYKAAFKVLTTFDKNGKALPHNTYHKFFINSQNVIILEDTLKQYVHIAFQPLSQNLIQTQNGILHINENQENLHLDLKIDSLNYSFLMQKMEIHQLPALKDRNHFWVDDVE